MTFLSFWWTSLIFSHAFLNVPKQTVRLIFRIVFSSVKNILLLFGYDLLAWSIAITDRLESANWLTATLDQCSWDLLKVNQIIHKCPLVMSIHHLMQNPYCNMVPVSNDLIIDKHVELRVSGNTIVCMWIFLFKRNLHEKKNSRNGGVAVGEFSKYSGPYADSRAAHTHTGQGWRECYE